MTGPSPAPRPADAERACRRALAEQPAEPMAMQTLGLILHGRGDAHRAHRLLARSVRLAPQVPEFHYNLANALKALGAADDAVRAFATALCLRPDFLQAWFNAANTLRDAGRAAPAGRAYRAAGRLAPELAMVALNHGGLCLAQEDTAGAAALYRRAVSLQPDYAEGWHSLGVAAERALRIGAATVAYRRAVRLRPDYADAHWNLSLVLLLAGQDREGGEEYEWRWRTPAFLFPRRRFPQPEWDGTVHPDVRLLVWGEQGVGDEVMFAGLVPDLLAAGLRCVLECDARLVPLFRRSFPGVAAVARRDPPAPELLGPAITHHVAAGSVAQRLRAGGRPLRPRHPYLAADEVRRAELRRRYEQAAGGRRVVGISWRSGNARLGGVRTIPLTAWAPILRTPGILFVNLQYGDCAADLAAARAAAGVEILHDPAVDPLRDLDGFAAQVAAMDLVVSIANTTIHTAGALGVPAWTAQPAAPDWRWGLGGEHGSWYPGVRVFRQDETGGWPPVIARIAAEIARWCRHGVR
ncbi:tetratricopeptide repeat protein [Azospirillum sp.]|uniref:tetratricopeptide repeat protein n=1 Tax=Azospirillum sp. TaxID=34012 RepID=UPI002D3ABCF0|nr:tetratricopeptide repeat protein [Azospirillum sp.]HYD65500.1 tetratricopeptide repeat protein [Azospirillum sp.]